MDAELVREIKKRGKSMIRLSELIEPSLLQECTAAGYISVREHPQFPELKIFNYSPSCQFEGYWNNCTELCRGLIIDSASGLVVARPFRKFFNLGTFSRPETLEENLPSGRPLITEKADGSMGVGFYYANEWRIATRGSFSSEQAAWANSWYTIHTAIHGSFNWPEGYTPVFEILYKDNQIVVSYPFEGLVLLGLVEIDTGREIGRKELEHWGNENYVPVIKKFNKSLSECAAENLTNFEGYVLTYPNGLKIKLKQENYVRLHRILTGLNPKAIWEMLEAGQNEAIDAILTDATMPVAFKAWFGGWVEQLRSRYDVMERAALDVFDRRQFKGQWASPPSKEALALVRKATALYFQKTPELCSILFAMLDKKDYQSIIWGKIKPRADETFKKDGE